MPRSIWEAPSAPGPLSATVELPGSKSLTARALLLGALGTSPTVLHQPLAARDTVLACQALSQLGVRFDAPAPDTLIVYPLTTMQGGVIDCGLAGTVMRFVPAIAAFGSTPVTFDGDPGARQRPMKPLLDTLSQLGAHIEFHGEPGCLPFTICGGPRETIPRSVTLDSSGSSQYLSALLIATCLAPHPLTIHLTGLPPSSAHVEMTVASLAARGVQVDHPRPDTYVVGATRPGGITEIIEPDLSNAGPFVAAALICGGSVTIPHWPSPTTQAGDEWRRLVPLFGGTVTRSGDALVITGSGAPWQDTDLDLSRVGELAPTVAALATLADSASTLRGIGHLRGHETDRLAALAAEITRCGAHAEVLDDGLRIVPGPLHAAAFESYHDHRMATFGALLGLRLPGSTVDDIATTAKTLPDFTARWSAMLSGQDSPAPASLAAAINGPSAEVMHA